MTDLKFLPYPYERLRSWSRADAAFESWCARWLAATRPSGNALRALLATIGEVAIAFDGLTRRVSLASGVGPRASGQLLARDTAVDPPAVRAPDEATIPSKPGAPSTRGPADATNAASPQGQRKATPLASGGGPRPDASEPVPLGWARGPSVPVDPRGATFADPPQLVATLASNAAPMVDQDAAYAELRVAGVRVPVVGGGLVVRAIAQRLLGGPAELAAPRRLVPAEHAIFALVLATLLEDVGARGEVVPRSADEVAIEVGARAIGVRIALGAELELGITAYVPRGLALHAPPPRRAPAWAREVVLELAVVVGRCALPREAIAALAPRDVITIDGARDRVRLELGDGELELALDGGGLAVTRTLTGFVPPPRAGADANPAANATARVASGYRVRDMALPDDAHAELTVTIGSTRLSLAAITELAAGQVLSLARPLAGPFDLVVAGKRIGTGELVDVDGELGVRVLTVG